MPLLVTIHTPSEKFIHNDGLLSVWQEQLKTALHESNLVAVFDSNESP